MDRPLGHAVPQARTGASGGAAVPPDGGPLLEVRDVILSMNGRTVLDRLSLEVATGSVHALLGPNGAGKSTVAYLVMGCQGYAPDRGELLFGGERIDGLALHERARRGLALAWQEPARFEGLAVRDFLALGAQVEDVAECLRRVGLPAHAYLTRPLDRTLSGGERKRIELAGVLARRPRLAILDEPTAGIDLLSLTDVAGLVDTMRAEGSSVLLITHQETVARHADRASLLCGGRVLRTGATDEVISKYKSRACQRCDGETCRRG